jgi:two-component system, chemotaxis family, protein-glutamate methylesterase/glutaminase
VTLAQRVVVMGASWGGLRAVESVLGALPPSLPAAVAVVLHRAPDVETGVLPALLGARSGLPVRDADDKDELEAGLVLVGPPDYHLLLEPGSVSLSVEEPVHHSRPSIDVLFETAAEAYGSEAVGVVLTGANDDGAAGLARIVQLGGQAIVQDPADAERSEMPRAAMVAVPAARVLPLAEIPAAVCEAVGVAA